MDFVQEQHTAVSRLHQAGLSRIRPGKSALDMAEHMGDEELRIVIVISAVKGDKRSLFPKFLHGLAISKHHMGKQGLADTCLSHNQGMQAIRRIEDSRLPLFHLPFKTLIRTDEPGKGIFVLTTSPEQAPAFFYIPELIRPLVQIQTQQSGQRFPVKITDRPASKLDNFILPVQFI